MKNIVQVKCGNVNCYIIASGKDAVLVDTARKKHRKKLLNACKPYNIHFIILTHGHFDHIQNAAFLSKALNAPIAMSGADVDLIKDNMSQTMYPLGFWGKLLLLFSKRGLCNEEIPQFFPDFILNDGDKIANLKVLALPGHTKGSIGLEVDDKRLIVGDAMMNMLYPSASLIYNDKFSMAKTIEKIASLGERTIYYGHGNPTKNVFYKSALPRVF